ncbi:hypothetical protein [Cellulomonas sp. SG140]|uniref:hypothetical protein n=1 Tax=Cellulomonas sp. SG140 TaxID=2976536 RepID=UPI0021E7FEB0|nr:hypothetical protein [Cellulomonas sp. SG140]
MAGAIDGNGIYVFAETDTASPFSTLLNLGQSATSTKVGNLQSQINAITTTRDAAWSSYTPTLTASTTNPSLGTGASVAGAYKMLDPKTCAWRVSISAGSSGVTVGSGTYYISVPVAALGGFPIVGQGWLYGTGGFRPFILDASGSSNLAARMIRTDTGGFIDATSGLGASSIFTMSGIYQVA